MNVRYIIIILSILSISATKKNYSTLPVGRFKWEYIDTKDHIILTRENPNTSFRDRAQLSISLKSKNKFVDTRIAMCGNDIVWKKYGTYQYRNKNLVLNYRAGTVSDGREQDSIVVFKPGAVIYRINYRNRDTMELFWVSGETNKTILKPKK